MTLEEGLDLMRAERWFDAHEALEDEWRDAPGPERDFLQGLVHVTVAWHHASRDNANGASRQLEKARRRLGPYAPEHRGVNVTSGPRPGRGGVRARLRRASRPAPGADLSVGARAAFLATLVLACTAADGLAAESLRPTGQVDQATTVVGPLRRQLLSGTANGNGADPAHPIVIRSALTVGTGSSRVRALLVTFRSRSGRQCVDVVFRAPGVDADSAHLSPSVSLGDLLHGFQQGIDPGRGARPVRQRAARDHGDPGHGGRCARAPLPRQPKPHRLAGQGTDPRRGARRARDPGVRERRAGRSRPLPPTRMAQKTGSRPNHSSARLT